LQGWWAGGRGGHGTVVAVVASPGIRFWVTAAWLMLRRPRLWPTALRQAHRLAPAGWWRRPPFLPRPDSEYLRFRLETQYGRSGTPAPTDLVTYLEWCHSNRVARSAA
jgi:hypothetical protein